ncbi:hypothetical protein [Rickettsia asembonensis]|uniref:Uncharacterized protein n=1 Tax=Rickettsia asembonensis TaxID=1068590 RepID=A0A0C2QWJ1_9RICK|nr:hypothetical protein [Rickettsia asembonensis]KIJ88209.1 hypothetical protein SB78_07190 [Rickettsia asembonensis]
MLFKNFNLVFTKVTEERTEELINLMNNLCKDFTPILQLTTNAAEAGINSIEFVGDVGDELQYHAAKQFGAACAILSNKIIINADQDIFWLFRNILIELGNAVNTELWKIQMENYKNAEEYAYNMEKAEFITLRNISKLIVEFLESMKTIPAGEELERIGEELLTICETSAEYSFEDYENGPGYIAYRTYHAENWKAFSERKELIKKNEELIDNKNKELIKLTFSNSTLKIGEEYLSIICNIGDPELVDIFLEQVNKIELESFTFDDSWIEWDKNILNKILKHPKKVESEGYLRIVLNNGDSETINILLTHSCDKKVAENLFIKALEKGYLKYIEKLIPYMPQKGEYM